MCRPCKQCLSDCLSLYSLRPIALSLFWEGQWGFPVPFSNVDASITPLWPEMCGYLEYYVDHFFLLPGIWKGMSNKRGETEPQI